MLQLKMLKKGFIAPILLVIILIAAVGFILFRAVKRESSVELNPVSKLPLQNSQDLKVSESTKDISYRRGDYWLQSARGV
jgi:hypothetical protein